MENHCKARSSNSCSFAEFKQNWETVTPKLQGFLATENFIQDGDNLSSGMLLFQTVSIKGSSYGIIVLGNSSTSLIRHKDQLHTCIIVSHVTAWNTSSNYNIVIIAWHRWEY